MTVGAHDSSQILVGIFVGGASRRMGSPKGLLLAPDEAEVPAGMTLLARTVWVAERALPRAHLVQVGIRPEYASYSLPALGDAAKDSGPLGGLVALLREAERRALPQVVALGCDFPYLTVPLLQKLGLGGSARPVRVPFVNGYYQPLVARYSTETLGHFEGALRDGKFSLQPLLRSLGPEEMALSPDEARVLRDWDEPADIER